MQPDGNLQIVDEQPPPVGDVIPSVEGEQVAEHTTKTGFAAHGHEGHHHPDGRLTDEEVLPPFFLMLTVIVVSQIVLFVWKKQHYSSYIYVGTVGLWVIPVIFSASTGFWRMVFIWTCYSAVSGLVFYRATRKALDPSTPRFVYTWFAGSNRVFDIATFLGVALNVAGFFFPDVAMTALCITWYGLYYGMLSRDCATVCTERMTQAAGYVKKDDDDSRKELASNICGLCGGFLANEEEMNAVEDNIQLSCKHTYHEFCIKGWAIIGKKDVCPYCNEKVEFKKLFQQPWDRQSLAWNEFLDVIRYMIVWNPLVFMIAHMLMHVFGLPH